MNCVANGRLLREGPFENIWIQPAAGDAGGALGAALFTWYQLLDNPREASPHDSQKGSLLGPRARSSDIERFLREQGAKFTAYRDETDLLAEVTRLLDRGQGRRLVLMGRWSSGRARSARAAFSAIRATPRCRAR